MMPWLQRSRLEVEDTLRYSPTVRHLTRDRFANPRTTDDVVACLRNLAAGARLAKREDLRDGLARAVRRRLDQVDWRTIRWSDWLPKVHDPQMYTSVILKPPTPGEKGVLYISLEHQWVKLLIQTAPAEIARLGGRRRAERRSA